MLKKSFWVFLVLLIVAITFGFILVNKQVSASEEGGCKCPIQEDANYTGVMVYDNCPNAPICSAADCKGWVGRSTPDGGGDAVIITENCYLPV